MTGLQGIGSYDSDERPDKVNVYLIQHLWDTGSVQAVETGAETAISEGHLGGNARRNAITDQ